MMPDTEELKRLAEAATPGPWAVREDGFAVVSEACWVAGTDRRSARGFGEESSKTTAAYIAAANPQAVMALIERLEKLEAERKGTVRLTMEQALNVQRALQRAQYLCEESAGESSGEDTQVYTRDLEALGEALDAIGEVCITDEGWLAAAIKEAERG